MAIIGAVEDTKPIREHARVGDIKSEHIRLQLADLLEEHKDLNATHAFDIGLWKGVELEIPTVPDATPVRCKPYTTNPRNQEHIDQTIREWLDAGICEPAQEGDWMSPVIVVTQGGGKKRCCLDLRPVNHRSTTLTFPLPRIHDILKALSGSTVFSAFDLRAAYMHVPIAKKDRYKTGFVTKKGSYRLRRMGFGFKNAPAVFQRAMQTAFGDISGVHIYLDDMIVASADEASHLRTLREVFKRLKSNNLKVNLGKCAFYQQKLKWLGHEVSVDGIGPDPEYVGKVLAVKRPADPAALGRFMGMVAWLARFIPDLALWPALCTHSPRKVPNGSGRTLRRPRSKLSDPRSCTTKCCAIPTRTRPSRSYVTLPTWLPAAY